MTKHGRSIDADALINAVERQSNEEGSYGYMDTKSIVDLINDMPSAQPEQHYDEWCTDCKEYDQERHCCPRWNRVIRQTLKDAQPMRWIPVSERLPNTNGIYNITRSVSDGFESFNITDTCYFDGSDTWHDDTRINHERKYITDVLAWCELPEPYREEGEQDDES